MQWYALDENDDPVPVDSMWEAVPFIGKQIAHTEINDCVVSTKFFAFSLSAFRQDLLYETMILGPENLISIIAEKGYELMRYSNKHAALAGHDQAVTYVKEVVKMPGETNGRS